MGYLGKSAANDILTNFYYNFISVYLFLFVVPFGPRQTLYQQRKYSSEEIPNCRYRKKRLRESLLFIACSSCSLPHTVDRNKFVQK